MSSKLPVGFFVLMGGEGHSQERALVEAAQRGDAAAFDRLVRLHTPKLYRTVRRFASDSGEAEAVVQEAWLRAWRALSNCDPDRPFFPWLARIAMNRTRDLWRKKRPTAFADLSIEPGCWSDMTPGPEELVEAKEELEWLAVAVERLRPAYRMAVALRYDAGLSYQEIATAMEVPVNTVRTYLHRAKAQLRTWMEARNV
jgi:RNA polymerase sigma-70 factor (ECF subfamily)